jgi:hypothetical protein
MTNDEYLKIINADPEGVKDSEDNSYKFIPISAVEAKLDEVFGGVWSWKLDREFFGKGYATGVGTLSYVHPVNSVVIHKTGTAGVAMSKEVTMDYPRLEAQVLLNAAKKIGKAFGRDLNRDREDKGLPVIQVETEENLNEELAEEMVKVSQFEFKEEAEEYIKAPYHFRYHPAIKKIVSLKPSKNGQENS